MTVNGTTEKRIGRWYFGGLASSGAAIVTHPLDLIKVWQDFSQIECVMHNICLSNLIICNCLCSLSLFQVHLQTQQDGKVKVVRLAINIVKQQGITALYSGLSASLFRQLTYSTARFGIYEVTYPTIPNWGCC